VVSQFCEVLIFLCPINAFKIGIAIDCVCDSISPPRPIHEAKLLALNTGLVIWASHVYYIASCPVGSSVFPSSFVDPASTTGVTNTECELRFGSWTLDSDLLYLQPVHDRFDPPVRRHPDWDVVRTTTRVYDFQYPWRPGVHYPVVGFRLSLRRRRRQRLPPHQRRVPWTEEGGGDRARPLDTDITPALRGSPKSSADRCLSRLPLLCCTLLVPYLLCARH